MKNQRSGTQGDSAIASWSLQKVKNLTFGEIWLFLVARILIGFGAGAYLERYFPQIIDRLALPVLAVGVVLSFIASKGYFRKAPNV